MKEFERIILIDDDYITLKYNELILSQSSSKADVISIKTSEETLKIYNESVLKNTLILVDMNLESENALDLLEHLNAHENYLPSEHDVYILTSAVLIDFMEISRKFSEVRKHIEKPLVLEVLNSILDEA